MIKNKSIHEKKQIIDKFKPFSKDFSKNINDWFKIELTYTSNAIEGNTLTRQETALVVEKGITVSGKSLVEHQEAINHSLAFDFVQQIAVKRKTEVKESDILEIHRIILTKIDDSNAGRYRSIPVRIAGSRVVMPNAQKVYDLMQNFLKWLSNTNEDDIVKLVADAHLRLVSIHPFVDGNGRTARLLMNLLLLQNGYPPAIIKNTNRMKYINSIEKAQLNGEMADYYKVIRDAIEYSMDVYLDLLQQDSSGVTSVTKKLKIPNKLLKIGDLANQTNELVSTIRYWTNQGLLDVNSLTKGGFYLYDSSMIDRVKIIRSLQKNDRLTVEEIREKLKK